MTTWSRIAPALVTPPSVQPVSVGELKAHLRIAPDETAEDAELAGYLATAIAHFDGVDGVLRRALLRQVWRESFQIDGGAVSDCWGRFVFPLRLAEVMALTEIEITDPEGQSATVGLSSASVWADASGWFVGFTTLPAMMRGPDSLRVSYAAGYGDQASDVPAPIRHAILLLAAEWYSEREASAAVSLASIPFGVANLVAPYRRVRI